MPSKVALKEVINLVYALDIKKPCYKIFKTYSEEGRHIVFDDKWIYTGEIKNGENFKLPIKDLMEKENNVFLIISKIKKQFLDENEKYDFLGKLVEKSMLYEKDSITGKVKLSPNLINKVHESIYLDSTSKLYRKDQEVVLYDLYIALLEQIKDGYKKDIINIFEKSILAAQILNII